MPAPRRRCPCAHRRWRASLRRHAVTHSRANVALARCVRQDELTLSGPSAHADGALAPNAARTDPTVGRAETPVLQVTNLVKEFPLRSGVLRRINGSVRAVDQVSLSIQPGDDAGFGGRERVGQIDPGAGGPPPHRSDRGDDRVNGKDITSLRGPSLRRHRESMQMVFQDPYSSLDPKQSIADIVGEPLAIHTSMSRAEREQRVMELLAQVGLGSHVLSRQPHEFSGGQRQRIAIARALALEPRLLVCDEPVSALDVSTQSQVINLLTELQHALGVAYLFIAHDLSVVRHISDRIAVMYLGQIVEEGEADEVYERPTHPYTAALLSSIPVPDPTRQHERTRILLQGDVEEATADGQGCRFRDRCPFAMELCGSRRAGALPHTGGHHRPLSSAYVGAGAGGNLGPVARAVLETGGGLSDHRVSGPRSDRRRRAESRRSRMARTPGRGRLPQCR